MLASPVLVGAGNNTKLETVKSREGSQVDPKDTATIDSIKAVGESSATAIKEAGEANAETLKSVQGENTETLKAIGETLTEVGTTLTAVKDAVTPQEPKADPLGFAVLKTYGQDKPAHDLAKAMFADGEFKEKLGDGNNFSIQKDVGVEVIKAATQLLRHDSCRPRRCR